MTDCPNSDPDGDTAPVPARVGGRFQKGFSGNPSGLGKDAARPIPRIPEMPSDQRVDGWQSALTGIGTASRDKRLSHTFEATCLSYQDAIELWRGDDLAARAITSVPAECFRQGYEISISDEGSYEDLKEEVEERLADLGVDDAIENAMCYERAYGGAVILLGANDNRPLHIPMDSNRVTSIDWLKVLEPIEILPVGCYEDPNKPKYGQPEFYQLNNYSNMSGMMPTKKSMRSQSNMIHESRLLTFGGTKVSNYQRSSNMIGPLWGDSILIRLVEVLRDFNVAWHAAGIIATDFSQSVISIENLMGLVAKNPTGLQARMQAIELGRSVANAILLDTKETYERQSTSIAGLPDLLDRLSSRLAAAINMPLTLLMGQSPKGLGNEGDSDVRFYYDGIATIQRRKVGPMIRRIAKMLMKTIRKRKIPKKWSVRFNPLWQLTDQEKAQARLTQARTDTMYIKMGVLTPDEIRRSRFYGEYSFETQAEEGKKAPGFLAPLPKGVLPGSTPGGATAGLGAVPKPAAQGPNAHGVSGYARRNPTGGGADDSDTGSAQKENRDAAFGGARPYAGLPIIVESPRGSMRMWGDGGTTKMRYDYGYIQNAIGADGDEVDVYLGPTEGAEWVYVIHQLKYPTFEEYDEDKVMLGFDSANHARDAYLSQYDDEGFFGGMSVMSLYDFCRKLRVGTGKIGHSNLDGDDTDDEIDDEEKIDKIIGDNPEDD